MRLSMSFERPVVGDSLRVEAVIDSVGRTTLYSSARLYDETGRVCARCQGLVKLSRGPWAEGRPSPAV
jgi:acyl-coenzyme A thioesterase PaaI-like protein